MPTYEYKCSHCEHTFEEFQSINAAKINECPECGKNVDKLISAGAGVIFKGSGFYSTDYRKETTKENTQNTPSCGNGGCGCNN